MKLLANVQLVLIISFFVAIEITKANVKTKEIEDDTSKLINRPRLIKRFATASASASSSSTSSNSNGSTKPSSVAAVVEDSKPETGNQKPRLPLARRPNRPIDDEKEVDDNGERDEIPQRPSRKLNKLDKHQRRQGERGGGRYLEEEPEDDDGRRRYEPDDQDYDEYGNVFFEPMNQMRRMMGDMFEHMQSMGRSAFVAGSRPGGLVASSSSSSASSYDDDNDDGYSRTSSVVSNNGRTKGLVSETRNGRTQTRRIGNWDDNDQ